MQDLFALAKLIPLSVRELSTGYYSEEQIEAANRYIFGPDTRLIQDGTYFVAMDGSQLVGAGGWGKRKTLFGGDQRRDGQDPLLDPATEPARLRAFYVHPEWARRGIASKIVEACFEAARSHGFRNMELLATLPGEPLYRKFGFEAAEPYSVPMPGGLTLPCIVMRRTLV
ncbi:MAG TPA: GNAT family N-acetyltransferase [Acidobacteriota bacterium]|nr:GNAT family N-acetyltransferase [Acidobacteriota bacterium]